MASPDSLTSLFPVPTLDQWRAAAERELQGEDFDRRLVQQTPDGLAIQPLYTRADSSAAAPLFSDPGWRIEQEIDSDGRSADDLVRLIGQGIEAGENAFRIRLQDGDSAARIDALSAVLSDVDLGAVGVSFEADPAPLALARMLTARAADQDLDRGKLHSSIGADPFARLLRRGASPEPFDQLSERLAACVGFCADQAPNVRSVRADGGIYHEAGASAIQELGYALSSAAEQLRWLTERGVAPDRAAEACELVLHVSPNLPLEIAKLRAARLLWTKLSQAFRAQTDRATRLQLHVRTGTRGKSLREPHNNLVRSTVEAFIAVVGGCDSLSIAPYDELEDARSATARRLAVNQQRILREEAFLDRAADPAAGSFALEALTNSVAQAAWELMQAVETDGGLEAVIRNGSVQAAVRATAARRRRALENGDSLLVGVTDFVASPLPLSPNLPVPTQDPATPIEPLAPARSAEPLERGRPQ